MSKKTLLGSSKRFVAWLKWLAANTIIAFFGSIILCIVDGRFDIFSSIIFIILITFGVFGLTFSIPMIWWGLTTKEGKQAWNESLEESYNRMLAKEIKIKQKWGLFGAGTGPSESSMDRILRGE